MCHAFFHYLWQNILSPPPFLLPLWLNKPLKWQPAFFNLVPEFNQLICKFTSRGLYIYNDHSQLKMLWNIAPCWNHGYWLSLTNQNLQIQIPAKGHNLSLAVFFFFSLTAYMCNRRDGGTVVRLQEIPSGWLYKNLSKNRAKLSLVFGHFYQCDNEWFVHDFYIQAKGGCQMCLSAVKLDHSGELFWDTQLTECMGICILSLAHWSEQRGSDVICILWKTDLEIFL